MAIYLDPMLPLGSNDLPNLVFHSGKGLAVSPLMLPSKLIPCGIPLPFGFGVTVRTSILTDDGGYPLPVSPTRSRGSVRTFLCQFRLKRSEAAKLSIPPADRHGGTTPASKIGSNHPTGLNRP